MAISFTRPDPSSPSSVASAAFSTSRKGFEQAEVREFLRMVAAELARLQERERFLERELRTSQRSTAPSSIALDEELVTKMLGEEAARILHTAREAANQIKVRAEEGAGRLLREATDESQRMREEAVVEAARRRQDATADAESEVEMAKQQGREMVNEARAYRERVLNELARRREIARQQIEQLIHGRDRLLQAFERSRLVAVDVMAELTPLGEPHEYVDLSPTTGPVPLMVPNMPRPTGRLQAVPEPDPASTTALHVVEDSSPAEDEIIVEADDQVSADEVDALITEPVEVSTGDESEVVVDAAVIEVGADDAAAVVLDIELAHDRDLVNDEHDGRRPAPVVSLFGGELDRPTEAGTTSDDAEPTPSDAEPTPSDMGDDAAHDETLHDDTVALGRSSADDLFARLRAARADAVAQRVIDAEHAGLAEQPATAEPATETSVTADLVVIETITETLVVETVTESLVVDSAATEDSVFLATPAAPVADVEVDDTPFARRDEALTPLIVAAARRLKRVLADEQNDVLHVLRGKTPVRSIDQMVPSEAEQSERYVSAISGELTAAAVAGALSMGATTEAAQRKVKKSDALVAAGELLVTDVVQPLRDRLARCAADADGDNDELVSLVRLAYREWKSQRIDEHLDDVARTAFGHGALAGVAAGASIRWAVDPNGPECPDAEDNALAGVVAAGTAFPTDHPCAPAHSGCRCMIVPAGS